VRLRLSMPRLTGAGAKVLRALSPAHFPYRKFVAALLIAGGGGWLFARAGLPLPWMLGAMLACTLGALLKAPIAAPAIVRPPMTMIIGVMLGAGFTPQIFGQLLGWGVSLLGLALFLVVAGTACVTYFRRVGKLDVLTAYFAGMPGGLVEMVAMADQRGGDVRTIALLHSARIFLLVMTLPFAIQWITGVRLGARPTVGSSVFAAPWGTELWLVGTALVGALIARLVRVRAGNLLGPMAASAAVHLLGWTNFVPPYEIVNGAQLIIGTTVGCSFAGVKPAEILRILTLSLGSTAILLVSTVAFAAGVAAMSSFETIPLILAYSPGGLAEMSLVALALHAEVAFVAGHHIARLLMVTTGASLFVRTVSPGRPD
jgi:membrane AbrB-like protein